MERAGVSVGTVSHVFNAKGRFTEATRARVMQAAADLRFTPNALIRSLQSGKTHTLGIFTWAITADTNRDISMTLLRGAMSGIAAAGRDALIYLRHPPLDEVSVHLFLDQRVDGLILSPGGLSAEGLQALADSGLPTVAIYQHPVPREIASVNIDNTAGLRAAMEHLIALGHRRIAFYASDKSFDFGQRFAGWSAAGSRIIPRCAWWRAESINAARSTRWRNGWNCRSRPPRLWRATTAGLWPFWTQWRRGA